MNFREILHHLTGISTPIFGVSWNPPESDRAIARRVLAFLEDRRILYSPCEAEIPEHCVRSILEIRHFLTSELGVLSSDKSIAQSVSAMRAACRKFLDTVQTDDNRIIRYGFEQGHYANWIFLSALGELRGVFGVHIATIAVSFGLDVESQLSIILPTADDEE